MGAPIIENWSEIEAEVQGVAASEVISGFSELEMIVNRVREVDDFPNLLGESEGSSILVFFPSELIEKHGLAPGTQISCRVRKAPLSRHFVHREYIARKDS